MDQIRVNEEKLTQMSGQLRSCAALMDDLSYALFRVNTSLDHLEADQTIAGYIQEIASYRRLCRQLTEQAEQTGKRLTLILEQFRSIEDSLSNWRDGALDPLRLSGDLM